MRYTSRSLIPALAYPKIKLSSIFEPFTQIERVISRKRDGVDLGLAIRKFVEAIGGKIWAESVQGQGSIFISLYKLKSCRITI